MPSKINNLDLIFIFSFGFEFSLVMDMFWILLVIINYFLACQAQSEDIFYNSTDTDNNIEEEKPFIAELYPSSSPRPGQTRKPRALFHKIHSGAAFLTGLKLGTILSKKGFELGHGKIASTHSFQFLGKPVHSAMSLSYGSIGSMLPVVEDTAAATGESKTVKKEDVFHVTVIENPSKETVKRLQSITDEVNDEEKEKEEKQEVEFDRVTRNVVRLHSETRKDDLKLNREKDFIEEHNKLVKDFNEGISKIIKQ